MTLHRFLDLCIVVLMFACCTKWGYDYIDRKWLHPNQERLQMSTDNAEVAQKSIDILKRDGWTITSNEHAGDKYIIKATR